MVDVKYAVQVKNVKKSFFLPNHKNDSIKRAITQAFKKKEKGGSTFSPLNGVSFNVEKGDFFGILGRNGSGKSTLLKIISEIYQPTSGSVKHDGKLVSFIELGVGFKSELTGRENIFLNGALLGFSKTEIEAMYDDIVSFAELEKFMDQKLKNYSSGMKVRLAFSVAIRAKADILILDEVLAVGDAEFQKKCNDYFRTLKDDGKTVILVTHSMGAVKQFCNKAILIEDGKVVEEGEADMVADAYTRLFIPQKPEVKVEPVKKNRWGSGEAQFDEVRTRVSKQKAVITAVVKNGDQVLSDVIIGLDINDGNKKLVGGIDDRTQLKHGFTLQPHEQKTVKFTFDNIFGGGEYYITMSLKSRDGEIYDMWKEADSFTNVTQADEYFPVVLPVEITVEK